MPFAEADAAIEFRELTDAAKFDIADVQVACARLNHPYIATAYRLTVDGASVVYVSDTAPFSDILFEDEFVARPPSPGAELPAKDRQKLARMREGVVRLCEGADLVIYDTMFTAEDYQRIPHYGHSRPTDAVEVCGEAGASRLALFHHAPERTDAEIDAILADTRAGRRQDGEAAGGRRRLRRAGRGAGAALMELSFWGVRGSIPAPGPATVRYGGNTSCVSVRAGAAAASSSSTAAPGARNLGITLMEGPFGKGAGEASILLSHAHWDHIQGFPFFVPLYLPGNRFHIYGGAKSSAMLEGILEGQMAPQYFPGADAEEHGREHRHRRHRARASRSRSSGCQVRARMNPHGRAGALAFRIEDGGAHASSTPATPATARAARPPSRSSCTGARTC